jgi:hypothetical protein
MAAAPTSVRLGSIVLAFLAACGCAYQPTIQHPMARPVRPEDAALDCAQLDAAILKTDTVRWVVRDDGGTLESSRHRAARYSANVLVVPLSFAFGVPGYIPDAGSAVLDAADHRIVGLLQLKRAHGCPPSETSEDGMTDLQLLDLLEPLMPASGDADRQMLDRRTALLDHLRAPLPAPQQR